MTTKQTEPKAETAKAADAPEVKAPKATTAAPAEAPVEADQDEAAPAPITVEQALEVIAPSGGQIALTVKDHLEGGYAITHGADGPVLARVPSFGAATLIVGAPAEAPDDADEETRRAVEYRKELEQRAAQIYAAEYNGEALPDSEDD